MKSAKTRRLRELYIKHTIESVKSTLESSFGPVFMFFWMLITNLIVQPFDYIKTKIQRCYDDSRMTTPVHASNGFLVPFPPKKSAKSNGVSFSSDGNDFIMTIHQFKRLKFVNSF